MSSLFVRINANEEQLTVMEGMCQMSEALMAGTLANRISGLSAEEAIPFITDWFRTVRYMAQATLMQSGIKYEVSNSVEAPSVATTNQAPPDTAPTDQAARHKERMTRVVAFLEGLGHKVDSGQLEELWKAVE